MARHCNRSIATAVALLTVALMTGTAFAKSGAELLTGRWALAQGSQTSAEQQKPYKTIDIQPCGDGLCGVSVNDKGDCGETLFRDLTLHEGPLGTFADGSGPWGKDILDLRIVYLDETAQIGVFLSSFTPGANDEGTRSVEYHETYQHIAEAACKVK